jgi:FKBP-type peptidyl-prolyl cis-trans isomerase SlyD
VCRVNERAAPDLTHERCGHDLERGDAMIQTGSNVSIHYTLTVDGQVVDSSIGGEPLTYVQGEGQIIPGLERQLEGLDLGDKRDVTVEPLDAYGPEDPNAFQKLPKDAFNDPSGLSVGSLVEGRVEGKTFRASIADVSESDVTLNFNHPLAGKTLRFAVEIVGID